MSIHTVQSHLKDRPSFRRSPGQDVRERLARRVRETPPSGIRRFFDILATMPEVISLGIGEPDFVTPE
ncbi:MAG: hypothetical protein ACE5LU_28385, partial [Anaerolineae bacterium]